MKEEARLIVVRSGLYHPVCGTPLRPAVHRALLKSNRAGEQPEEEATDGTHNCSSSKELHPSPHRDR